MPLVSDFRPLCPVTLPFAMRHKYMHGFNLSNPVMAEGFEDYADIVAALCRAAGADSGVAYMTVDEKLIPAGRSQSRPGPHVDGCFSPQANSWEHKDGWRHGSIRRMPVIVAANVAGCRAWRGTFVGDPASDGDLSHISGQLGAGEVLPPNVGYLLAPDCVHESMVFDKPTRRTFLRIALPVDYDFSRRGAR